MGLLYFIPAIVAKGKRNATSILVLNLLLGWTILGWIAALIWALSNDAPIQKVVVQSPSPAPAPAAPSIADELDKLRSLRNAGELTNEEFLQQKARLLRS
ncbi:superinfection immunity protein [Hymenobacter sp. YC55]|uniref:superinfection immunity protein n=1 Tax=Hymenobacter sp. YC55 TaxID=3034019 RepID=UPI0023FA1300|nr:superinfection immunity protein [Hymenobacter sp. YC55]